jgi:hypothetical protein
MRIFWSWQSDTHGNTGRHFVKGCLKDARDTINQTIDVTEPERDVVELDHDREGVVGHPDLANTIFGKIAAADVFVGDVTIVAELKVPVTPDNPEGIKKLINSNVGIEYGYAVGKLSDEAILLVMNLHYGPLAKLPFDLSHKVAPCRYRLAPDATKVEIEAARKALTQQLVEALKLHLDRIRPPPAPVIPFERTPSTATPAVFWRPGEILGTIGEPHPFRHDRDSMVEYTFDPEHAFYLRLMPSTAVPEFGVTRIMDVIDRAHLDAITEQYGQKIGNHNAYGAIAIVPTGSTKGVLSLSQIFQNGEIWGVSDEFVIQFENNSVVRMPALAMGLGRALESFIAAAYDHLSIEAPYDIEIGAVGLKGLRLSVPPPGNPFTSKVTQQIFTDRIVVPSRITALTPKARNNAIQEFLRRLYDLANFRYQPPPTA